MDEQQLEEYVIDRGQSKSSYFLFYKNEQPAKVKYDVTNNPLKSKHFLKRLHAQVREKERQYHTIEDESSEEESQQDNQEIRQRDPKKEEEKKVKEYFGQFKRAKTQKNQSVIKLEDQFESKVKNGETLAK